MQDLSGTTLGRTPVNISTPQPEQSFLEKATGMAKKTFYDDEIYKQDGIMTLTLWLYRDQPDIANNIFVFVNELLRYKNYVKMDVIKAKNIKSDDE
jgi:hypothetical protein